MIRAIYILLLVSLSFAFGQIIFTASNIATNADGATSVFAADMDGDGDMDILSASYTDDTIAWYENDGAANPTWTASDIALSADYATSVFAADMDGDGDMDIVSASANDDTIAWYENDSGGTDSAPTVANAIADVAVAQDASNTVINLSSVFTDSDNDDSVIMKTVLSNTNQSLVTTTLSGNNLTLDFQASQTGTATIIIQGTSNGVTVTDTFQVMVSSFMEGCTDSSACNYDSNASEDDGSCMYPDDHHDCDGNCLVELDCAGNCCVIGEDGCYWQETGPCGEEEPSNGMDSCGVCGGDNSSCLDCAGEPCSDAYMDNCGDCDDNPSNDCVQDCSGEWGGEGVLDECGECSTGGTPAEAVLHIFDISTLTAETVVLISPSGYSECYYTGSGGGYDISSCDHSIQFTDDMYIDYGSSWANSINEYIAAYSAYFTSELNLDIDELNNGEGEVLISTIEVGSVANNAIIEVTNPSSFSINGLSTLSANFSGAEGTPECIEACDGNYYNDGSEPVIDDCGVCGGENSCYGCMDEIASNYNGEAGIDDGTCEYSFTYVGVNFDGSIQDAIDEASAGDTVIVAPGIYYGGFSINKRLTFASKHVFTGDSLDISNTILDGGWGTRVLHLLAYSNNSVIQGFTIQNGYKYACNNWYDGGGGIKIESSNNVTLNNLIIKDNVVNICDSMNEYYAGGGGIYLSDAGTTYINNVTIVNNTIDINNIAGSYARYAGGGGIYTYNTELELNNILVSGNFLTSTAYNYDGLAMDNNSGGIGIYSLQGNINGNAVIISNNYYDEILNSESIYGGGMAAFNVENINLSNSIISNNSSKHGGGIYLDDGNYTLMIEKSKISGNYARGNGGGIYTSPNSLFNIVYSEISNNISDENGGGIYFQQSSSFTFSFSPFLLNVSLVNNQADAFGSGIFATSGGANPIIQNSIIWGNESIEGGHIFLGASCEIIVNNSDLQGGLSAIIGFDDIIYNDNIDADPQFVDSENGDYHLQVISPCIDAGSPNSPLDPDGTIVDMGAYYYDQAINIPGCMDESAQNYEPEANIDLGCIYGPSFISIYDTPDDQGGYVFLNFNANSLDVLPETIITHYAAWRYVENERGWEHLGNSPAGYEEDYTFTAPTVGISIPADSIYKYTDYKIKAHTSDPTVFYESEIATGYSVDNVAAATPTELSATVEEQTVYLTWSEPVDEDFSYFSLFRDGYLVNYMTENTYSDSPDSQNNEVAYHVTSTDIHGNESDPSESITVQLSVNQTVQTDVGWNWFSINVESDDMSVNNVLNSLDATAGDFIKSQSASAEYYDEFGWFGSLENINIIDMYQLDIANGGEIAFTGYPVDPSSAIIHLTDGWNWIGYTPQNPGIINDALGSIGDSGIFIKNQAASAEYYGEFGWWGGLDFMSGGDGYQIKVSGEADLIYPDFELDDNLTRTKKVKVLPSLISEWVVNPHAYEFNGVITLSVDNRDDIPGDYIAAFVDGECRGVAERMDFPFDDVDRGIYILMAYSNMEEEEKITFKYFSDSEEEVVEYTESLEFSLDMVVGNGFNTFGLSKEYIIPDEFSLSAAYPNPFNPTTTLSFAIPVDSDVSLSIYNMQGREVSTLISGYMDAGYHSVVWNADSHASGVYFVKMMAGEFVSTQKLMLVK